VVPTISNFRGGQAFYDSRNLHREIARDGLGLQTFFRLQSLSAAAAPLHVLLLQPEGGEGEEGGNAAQQGGNAGQAGGQGGNAEPQGGGEQGDVPAPNLQAVAQAMHGLVSANKKTQCIQVHFDGHRAR
jgi:hypothetical protein